MISLAETLETVLQKWRSEGIRFKKGTSPERIQLFEQAYRVIMPADLKTYFMTAEGFSSEKKWEWDAEMVSFWHWPDAQDILSPKKESACVAPLPSIWHSAPSALNDLFVIGDYSIMCSAFCVRMKPTYSETSEVFSYDGEGAPFLLADSYQKFLQNYIRHGVAALFPS